MSNLLEHFFIDNVHVVSFCHPPPPPPHLGPAHADDVVHVAVGIIEEGHGDGMLAGGDPVSLRGRVDLEDVGPGTEDRLLPGGGSTVMAIRKLFLYMEISKSKPVHTHQVN